MRPPNRWYQLSILQMLVAMAVVSAAVHLNLTATPEENNLRRYGERMYFLFVIRRWISIHFLSCLEPEVYYDMVAI